MQWDDGLPRPDVGHDCPDCGAQWVGQTGDPCPWCQRLIDDQRRQLLDPPWLATSTGHPRYDELGDVDRAVWDRTRHQIRGADSIVAWVARLRRAVETGLITMSEAERAMRRIAK